MTTLEDMTAVKQTPTCTLGEQQALPNDYDHTFYIPIPLLPPGLAGSDLGARISTSTMTNTVPMSPVAAVYWKRAINQAADYLKTSCLNDSGASVYVLAGTTINIDKITVIGNGVTVPEVVWLAACCIGENLDKVSSFGLYTYNQYDRNPVAVSVQGLENLLNSEYSKFVKDEKTVSLFPGYEEACRVPENDVSSEIDIHV